MKCSISEIAAAVTGVLRFSSTENSGSRVRRIGGCLLPAVLLGFLGTSTMAAQQTVYTYVGQNFTSTAGTWAPCTGAVAECAGGVNPPSRITASLTFSAPLAPNLNWAAVCLPGSQYCPSGGWSISDGLHSFNQSSPGCQGCYGPLYVSTDANGQITYWAFRVIYTISVAGTEYTEDLQTVYYPPGLFTAGPFVSDASAETYSAGGNHTINGVAQNNTSNNPAALPGQWSTGPQTPTAAISNLISLLSNPTVGLSAATIGALTDKLQAAQKSIAKGNVTAAVNQIQAFVHQVQSLQKDGLLSAANAALLIAAANTIIQSL